ncbi:MAG TPA: ABC transporter ATP-binding protein [Candidatus Kapabacteria bacterium]|nr:ABC transporter ATP-binding protein [Candidatus Kapabacteria bacterium]
MINVDNLYKSFESKSAQKTLVLKGLNLEIEKNKFITLMGPSGAGKSTLLYILGMLDKADSGSITYYINDEIIKPTAFSDKRLSNFRNKEIGFIFQFYHLLPEFNAIENVMLPALIAGIKVKEAKALALELIEKVGLLNKINSKPNELSGGEQQRIAISRALINKPKIILADEPTGNLDSYNANIVVELLHKVIEDYNITMLMATHSIEIAKSTDKIIFLKDGNISSIETN